MINPTEVQRKQWDEHGYVVIDHALQGEELRRLQAAFDDWAEQGKPQWIDRVEAAEVTPTYYDIPNVLDKDDLFVNLVDHLSYYGFLKAFTDEHLLFLGAQARTVPVSPVSYHDWHNDVPRGSPLQIKVQIYVTDVAPRSGEFAYVPGSHKPHAGPYGRVQRLASMPGHKTFPGPAGTAIMFNAAGWHAAMDNETETPRKSIILMYEQRTPGRVHPDTFASIAHACTTPERRALFSLEG